MNDVVKGLTKIRNTILVGFIFSFFYTSLQLIIQISQNQNLKQIILGSSGTMLILALVLINNYFSGLRLIRGVNIVDKLNNRLDEVRNNLRIVIGIVVVSIITVLLGVILTSSMTIIIGSSILIFGMLPLWIGVYKTIQIQGILGVCAKSKDLTTKAITTLTLFKYQIAITIIAYLASYFKSYSLYGNYFIQTISIIYSLFFFVNYLGLYNLAINIYENDKNNTYNTNQSN